MSVEPAPVWKRLFAWMYDGLILTALLLVSGLIAALLAGGEAPPWLVRTLIIFICVGYFAWSWRFGGKTAGMRAWRLRLVTDAGTSLTWAQVWTRMAVSVACLAPLGMPILSAWILPSRQTIYDRLSNTCMVVEPKSMPRNAGNQG